MGLLYLYTAFLCVLLGHLCTVIFVFYWGIYVQLFLCVLLGHLCTVIFVCSTGAFMYNYFAFPVR
jgi:hypothetical protein